MFFRQRAAANATLSYFFGCTGIGKAVAVDVVAGDEEWFIAEAAKVGVPISYVIDTHVHADHYSGGHELARRAGHRTACTRATGVGWGLTSRPCPMASGSTPATWSSTSCIHPATRRTASAFWCEICGEVTSPGS